MNCKICNDPRCLTGPRTRKCRVKELVAISKEWYELHRLGLQDLKECRDLEIQVTNLREELRKDKENES